VDIKDKIVMITGGASGLGLATAKHLAVRGAKIVLLDLNEENLESAPKEIDGETLTFKTNVTEEESVQNAIDQTLEKFGALHGLVNCAGIGSASKTVSKNGAHPLDYFKLVVEINLIGTFNVLRLAAEAMGKNIPETDNECGVIINTASVAAFDGQVGQVAYSASKGGVAAMTLPIARDLARMGIRINTIAPGIFDTPMMAMASDEIRKPLIEMTQFPKRLGYPDEFAKLAAQIIENPFLNGETIRLDGAIRMQPK
jgi:NAD(P)-dependent dehydrogenase (short-subunit alcohol dehydrogenase family)